MCSSILVPLILIVILQFSGSECIPHAKHSEYSRIRRDAEVVNKSCGRVQIRFLPLITFSHPTYHGEFPWHAAIYRTTNLGSRQYICGGSLLNENTILTAGSCVKGGIDLVSPSSLIVAVGKYDLDMANIDTRESHVERIILHELYDLSNVENDIAILKLSTALEFSNFIQPICITNATDIFESNIGVVPGWGFNEHGTVDNLLTQASVPIRTDDECRASNHVLGRFLNGNNFCAGYQNGTNVCSGDSGGGLVFQHDQQWYIRGIVSLSVKSRTTWHCDPLELVIFTDVVKYYDWIMDKL